MMKRFLCQLLILGMLFGAVGCHNTERGDVGGDAQSGTQDGGTQNGGTQNGGTQNGGDNTPPADEGSVARDKNKQYRILFIGNSFTYYNKMPKQLFSKVCKDAGYNVVVDQVTKGGNSLWKQADPADVLESPTANETGSGSLVAELLAANKYDFVVIQEQSGTPVADPALFYTGARLLAEKVRENGAELYLYATWGYEEGYSKLPTHGGTPQAMEMKLRAAYTAIAEELGAKVCHAGTAFSDVYNSNKKNINLYWHDLFHPSIAGSSLAAYTIFGEIFGVDVRTLNCDLLNAENSAPVYVSSKDITHTVLTDMTPDAANTILRAAAYKATFVDHAPAEGYQTSSRGIGYTPSSIDISKTEALTAKPSSEIISIITRNSGTTGNGWLAVSGSTKKTASGVRGDIDKVTSTESSTTGLTPAQQMDVARTAYGVSVIGLKKMGYDNAVNNLVNGHWNHGNDSNMASLFFDGHRYNLGGIRSDDGEFVGLITLNFGEICTFDAIGYISGSLYGIPQAQKVYVSDDGINFTLVESASYDAVRLAATGKALQSVGAGIADITTGTAKSGQKELLFDMNGVTGKYIRIGIVAGAEMTSTSPLFVGSSTTDSKNVENAEVREVQINTRELVVFGKKA